MITGITIQNFKGIGGPLSIDISPITLLFGANSAGKSTIMHALHYAREVFERHNLDTDETIAGGKYIDLGGYKRLVHRSKEQPNFSPESPIRIRIDLEVCEDQLRSFYPDINGMIASARVDARSLGNKDYLINDELALLAEYSFDSLFKDIFSTSVELEIAWSSYLDRPFVSKTTVYFNDEPFAELEANKQMRGVILRFLDTKDRLSRRKEPGLDHPCLKRTGDLHLERGELPLYDQSLLQLLLDHCGEALSYRKYQIEFNDLEDALPPLDTPLPFTAAISSLLESQDYRSVERFQLELAEQIVLAISQYIVGPCQLVRENLKSFRYLGPLRDTPPRNYAAPRFHNPARWASGLGAWDALDSGSDDLVDEVGTWLYDEDKLDSGCRIERRRSLSLDYSHPLVQMMISGRVFEDLDSNWSLDLSQTISSSRVVVVNKEGVELHPHEVGIGISQVVPVVVTALDDVFRLLAIEQPELHIHPRLQAKLADLFIEAIHKRKHRFIIETHSEHLILRLLRRIRETEKEKAPLDRTLRTDDIAIYYLKQTEGRSQAIKIDVDVNGDFIQPWPDDFFEIDFFERFPDAR